MVARLRLLRGDGAPTSLREGEPALDMTPAAPRLFAGVGGQPVVLADPAYMATRQRRTTISDTPPLDPAPGDFWWSSLDLTLYIWYQDPTSAQWVVASPNAISGGGDFLTEALADLLYLKITGGCVGPLTVNGPLTANAPMTPNGGIIGITNGSNATAGHVGEYQQNAITGVTWPAGTSANVTSLNLPPGDWDVWGTVSYSLAGPSENVQAWTNTVSAAGPGSGVLNWTCLTAPSATYGGALSLPVNTMRLNLTVSTTVYLGGYTGGVGGIASGVIAARRVR